MELSKNAQKIMDLVKEMGAIELNQLVKALEEEFGVTAAAMVVAWWAAGGDAGAWAWSDTVNVELTEIGQQKIAVIKVVKETLNIDLAHDAGTPEEGPAPEGLSESLTAETEQQDTENEPEESTQQN